MKSKFYYPVNHEKLLDKHTFSNCLFDTMYVKLLKNRGLFMKKSNFKKKIVLILSLFLIFLVIGTVSAVADDNMDNFETHDGGETVDGELSEEIIGDGETGSFNNLTDEITGSQSVTLNKNYTLLDSDKNDSGVFTPIKLSGGLVLDGSGYTIDSSGYNGTIFQMGNNNTKVTLKNINFINGGVILSSVVINNGNNNGLKFINCTFDNCNYPVKSTGWARGTSFTDCNFTNCNGAIYQSAPVLFINNCNFDNNNGSDLITLNGQHANVQVSNSNFTNSDCRILNAKYRYLTNNYGQTWFKNCKFDNINSGSNDIIAISSSGEGNKLTNKSDVPKDKGSITLESCNFTNINTYSCLSLDTWCTGHHLIKDCIFENIYGVGCGAALLFKEKEVPETQFVNVTGCTFKNVTSHTHSGAVFWMGPTGTINNCSFEDVSTETEGGGAVNIQDVTKSGMTIENVNFTNCHSATTGGALTVWGSGVNITESNFNNCSAESDGGAVYASAIGNNLNVSDCSFTNCSSDKKGGALTSYGNGTNIEGSSFEGNTADIGAAVYLSGENANLTSNEFSDNHASDGDNPIVVSADTANSTYIGDDNTGVGDIEMLNNMKITISPNDKVNHVDEEIAVAIEISDKNGTVIVNINDNETEWNATEGRIDIPLGYLPVGDYNITVEYIPSLGYVNSTQANKMNKTFRVQNWNFTDLQNLINQADDNVTLEHDYVCEEGEDPISIDKPIAIYGNGHTINANNQSSIFEINTDNVTVSDVALTGANGSAISANGDNIKIEDVEITDSTGDAAAIDIEGDNAEIKNADISNVDAAAINVNGSDVTISDTKINNAGDGIIIEGDGDANITGVDIRDIENDALDIVSSNVDINDVNLTNVTNSIDIDSEGNVSISNIDIENITNCPAIDVNSIGDIEISNVAMYGVYGAGVEASSSNGTLTITNVTNYTIIPVEPNMTVDIPVILENTNTTIPVKLPSNATGNVTLIIDGETADTQDVVNGSAILNVPHLSEGDHNITVSYSGDIQYLPQSEEFNVSVNETIFVTADDLTKYYSAPDKFTVNVTDSKGNPLNNITVQITLNGKNYIKHTDENGLASLSVGLLSGEYEVTATSCNITLNRTITILSTVNGSDIIKVFRNGTQYYATFKDNEGNYLTEGTQVKFNINGVLYTRKITGSEGLAKLNINLPEGEYIITAINLNTGENAANNITVLSRLNGSDIQKYYRNGTHYEVAVFDDNGNPVGAGAKVSFNINGVIYNRTTNPDGIAKLVINLPPGNYTITAEHEGCLISNTIEVLSTLSANDLIKQDHASKPFVATVLDSHGQPYENQTVSFNINGVLYKRTTNSEGQAKLNINLPYGEYIITSTYDDYSVANTITVTY